MKLELNPYHFADFGQFFFILMERMGKMLTGQIGYEQLASDELQLLILAFTSISAAIVGVFLMLRRMAMLANSLSHTILLGIVIAFLIHQIGMNPDEMGNHEHEQINLSILLFAAIITGVFTTFLTQALTNFFRLPEDASNGLVFSTLFALGVVLVTLFTRNAHIGVEAVMGNVDMLDRSDLTLAVGTCIINGLIIALFFKEYKITTFDPGLAVCLGISPFAYNYLLMTQVSFTAVSAFRSVGVLMVLSLIIAPPMIASMWTHRLSRLIALAGGIGVVASILGVAITRHFLSVYNVPLSTGGVIVTILVLFYSITLLIAPESGYIANLWRKKSIENEMNKRGNEQEN